MNELFKNDGFGWTCVACSGNSAPTKSRLLVEGEAESKTPELSQKGLAVWDDKERTILRCPDCGITAARKQH